MKRFLLVLVAAALVAPAATAGPSPHMYDTLVRDIAAIDDPNTRPLLASAEASQAAFLRGDVCAAFGALGALENKLDARGVDNPDYRTVRSDVAEIRAAFIDDPNARPACVDNPDF